MRVNGKPYRTIWPTADNAVEIIDQTRLPHEFVTLHLDTMRDAERAIKDMQVRGAPLIGVTAAYGVALSMKDHASDAALAATCGVLLAARPTAVNLRWGVERMRAFLAPLPESERAAAAWQEAARIADEDVAINAAIGRHGRQDDADAGSLYEILEQEIVPLYYIERGADNVPHPWVEMMKESLRTITPQFSTRRMVKEYLERLYLPAMPEKV